MSNWLAALFGSKEPAGPTTIIRRFEPSDAALSHDNVAPSEDGWLVQGGGEGPARLFEVPVTDLDQCLLTYRAVMRSEELTGRAYLEMWVRLPGRGEFFSRGLAQPIKGTTDWASYETPFRLKKGQRPDLVKLNLVVEGQGKVWMKDVELLKTPR